jgi:hypothetical protein
MPKLKTTQNTVSVERTVRKAARAAKLAPAGDLAAWFEHGQWWVENIKSGAQWSVCDAIGANTFYGFCFEQVSRGDGD